MPRWWSAGNCRGKKRCGCRTEKSLWDSGKECVRTVSKSKRASNWSQNWQNWQNWSPKSTQTSKLNWFVCKRQLDTPDSVSGDPFPDRGHHRRTSLGFVLILESFDRTAKKDFIQVKACVCRSVFHLFSPDSIPSLIWLKKVWLISLGRNVSLVPKDRPGLSRPLPGHRDRFKSAENRRRWATIIPIRTQIWSNQQCCRSKPRRFGHSHSEQTVHRFSLQQGRRSGDRFGRIAFDQRLAWGHSHSGQSWRVFGILEVSLILFDRSTWSDAFHQLFSPYYCRADGSFEVNNLPPGSYLIDVTNPNYLFEPVRVDITSKGKLRARKVNYIQTSAVQQLPYPLRFKPKTPFKYFQTRENWKVTDFLFNPMVIANWDKNNEIVVCSMKINQCCFVWFPDQVLMMLLPMLLILVVPKMVNVEEGQKVRRLVWMMIWLIFVPLVVPNQYVFLLATHHQDALPQMPQYDMPELSEMMTSFFHPASNDASGQPKQIKSGKKKN